MKLFFLSIFFVGICYELSATRTYQDAQGDYLITTIKLQNLVQFCIFLDGMPQTWLQKNKENLFNTIQEVKAERLGISTQELAEFEKEHDTDELFATVNNMSSILTAKLKNN